MKRILVLGGSGFIGRHVCEKAGQLNCRITVPTRRMLNARTVAAAALGRRHRGRHP